MFKITPLKLGLLIGAIAGVTYLVSCSSNPQKGGLDIYYPDGNLPTLSQKSVFGRDIHYATFSGQGGTPLVFIHGSPGDWQAWLTYLNHPTLETFGPRLAVDRPGFGASTEGGIVTDLQRQANMLAALLPNDKPSIVIGHSLGSPLAAWIAIEYPEKVCGVISVAGSLAPDLEGMRWYNEVATWKLFQPMIPQALIDSNREIQALRSELNRLEQAWPQLQTPLVALQGMQDELVNPKTADYLESVINPSQLTIKRYPEQGHFVVWEAPELITQAILEMDNTHCHLASSI